MPTRLVRVALLMSVVSGQLALRYAGLLQQLGPVARCDAQTTNFADAQTNVIVGLKPENGSNDRPKIDRKDLRAMLLSSVSSNKVRWAFRLRQAQKEVFGSIPLRFTNGNVVSAFRLVVGADAPWSKLRNLKNRVQHKE